MNEQMFHEFLVEWHKLKYTKPDHPLLEVMTVTKTPKPDGTEQIDIDASGVAASPYASLDEVARFQQYTQDLKVAAETLLGNRIKSAYESLRTMDSQHELLDAVEVVQVPDSDQRARNLRNRYGFETVETLRFKVDSSCMSHFNPRHNYFWMVDYTEALENIVGNELL